MPLILDNHHAAEETRLGIGFDLSTATTLYWKPVPVKIKQLDREDHLEQLTFRILTGVARQNHNLRILRIHISSESDLAFLHTLEVSDDDFQSLKTEQGILVDFASFPGKIISLLDKCTASQPMDAPRFTSVLTVRGSESLFKILETNDFKQLPHITLAFRPGNDAAVKQFLAFRLVEVKADREGLSAELQAAQDDCKECTQQLASARQQLAAVREQYERHLLEASAAAKTAQAEAHEEKAREKAELREVLERSHEEEAAKLRAKVEQLAARLAEGEAENRKLRDARYELDARVSELSHRLGGAEGANRSLEDECTRLKAQNTALAAAKHDVDMALHEVKTRASALDEKVSSQADVVEQQRARLADLEASLRQWEARCGELRGVAAAAEERAKDSQAELTKGNAAIDKLAADLRSSKEKVRRKTAILQRQEEELQLRDNALATVQREAANLAQQLEAARNEVGGLRAENSELKGKLEDSRQQLQSNEQMIRWLNQQVTEKERLVSGGMSGSRYSFQPMLLTSSTGPSLGPSISSTTASAGLLAGGHTTPATTGRIPGPESTFVSKYSSIAPLTSYGGPRSTYGAGAMQSPLRQQTPALAHSTGCRVPSGVGNAGAGAVGSYSSSSADVGQSQPQQGYSTYAAHQSGTVAAEGGLSTPLLHHGEGGPALGTRGVSAFGFGPLASTASQ